MSQCAALGHPVSSSSLKAYGKKPSLLFLLDFWAARNSHASGAPSLSIEPRLHFAHFASCSLTACTSMLLSLQLCSTMSKLVDFIPFFLLSSRTGLCLWSDLLYSFSLSLSLSNQGIPILSNSLLNWRQSDNKILITRADQWFFQWIRHSNGTE